MATTYMYEIWYFQQLFSLLFYFIFLPECDEAEM